MLCIKRKGECKREREGKNESRRGKKKEKKNRQKQREGESKKEEKNRVFTAGRAKKEIPKRAQPEATNFPAHVRGTVSPYPTVHSVICRLLYQKNDQWLVDPPNGQWSMSRNQCPKNRCPKNRRPKNRRPKGDGIKRGKKSYIN